MANNEFNAKGRRMVYEEDIAKIGEKTEFTAGTGIDITEDVISIDTETVAVKSDIPTVAANTGATPSATLTDIQVGETVYGIDGGSDVEADEKTIITNLEGKLETAVGGWKETTTYYGCVLPGTSSDWDLVDSTLANQMFNYLEANVSYNVQLQLEGATFPKEITSAVISSSKTSTKYGGQSALVITDSDNDTHTWEFYVDISTNQIHVWPSDSWVSPSSEISLSIDFGSESGLPTYQVVIYHKIKSEYIPDKYRAGSGITISNNGTISLLLVGTDTIEPTSYGDYYRFDLKYDYRDFINLYDGYEGKLGNGFGHAFKDEIDLDTSLITSTTDIGTSMYETSQSDFIKDIEKLVKNVFMLNHYVGYLYIYNLFYIINSTMFQKNIVVYVSINNGTVTVSPTSNADNNTSISQFTFDETTGEILTHASKVYIPSDIGTSLLSASSGKFYLERNAQYADIKNPLDPKFIPIDNSTITVDGNGKLAASGGSSYTFTDGLTESSGTVSWNLNNNIKTTVTTSSSGLTGPGIKYASDRTNLLMDWGSSSSIDGSGNISNYSAGNAIIGLNNQIEAKNCKRNVLIGKENKISSEGPTDCDIVGHSNLVTNKKNVTILGSNNEARYDGQTIIGKYSNGTVNKAFIVGNGTSTSSRSNLFTVDWNGILECTNIPAAPTTQGTYKLTCTVDAQGNPTFSWEQ